MSKDNEMVTRFAQARARDVEPVGWARLDADGLLDFSDAEVRPTQADIDYLPVGSAYVPVYPQSAIDTLRAQLESAERGITHRDDDMVVPMALWEEMDRVGLEWKARAEAAEAEVARLGAVLDRIAGYTLSQFAGPCDMVVQCVHDAMAARTEEAAP